MLGLIIKCVSFRQEIATKMASAAPIVGQLG